jgi:hypothetical protein
MANRYIYTDTKEGKDKKRFMQTTIYPKVLPDDNDLYIITEQGDRLDILANTYYKNPSMWWVIATANNINDANFYIEPGTQLRIPANISKILNDLQKLNK